mgnify:CR=1 FL=1
MAATRAKRVKRWPLEGLLLVLMLLASPEVQAASDLSNEAKAAFRYLNKQRIDAGMIAFRWNPILERAARNHAIYLKENNFYSHLQFADKPHFTGVKPGDRAIAQGYHTHYVTENFSSGGKDPLKSVDGLMGAIYHRFGFLDFTKDEIGIALIPSGNQYWMVFNMGNRGINKLCQFAIHTGQEESFRDLCKQVRLVSAKKVRTLEAETARLNRAVIQWPPDQARGIPPAFYDEIPDPLPAADLSGYPVSLQFNPVLYNQIELETFTLTTQENQPVEPVFLMKKHNDPHRILNRHQFALFPLKRLKWGTTYHARVRYRHNGLSHKLDWTFTTKVLPYPVFVIAANAEALMIRPRQTYAVYFPPSDRHPYVESLSVEAPYSVQVSVEWEDRNTLLLSANGERCQPVLFRLDHHRSFSIRLSRTDNLNTDHRYPERSVKDCQSSKSAYDDTLD